MNFLSFLSKFWEPFKPIELVYGTLIIFTVIFLVIWGIRKKLLQLKEYLRVMIGEDPNLPESVAVLTTDGAHFTLEREWIDGEWRYVLKGSLPYRFGPVKRPKMSNFDK